MDTEAFEIWGTLHRKSIYKDDSVIFNPNIAWTFAALTVISYDQKGIAVR